MSLPPSVRVSGGTPAGMPDYKPVNRMAPEQIRKVLSRAIKPQLFQVWVETRDKGIIPVAPKVPLGVADSLAAAIRGQIALGTERDWSNPTVIACG